MTHQNEHIDIVDIPSGMSPLTYHTLDTRYIRRLGLALEATDGGKLALRMGDTPETMRTLQTIESSGEMYLDLNTEHLPRLIQPIIQRRDSEHRCVFYCYRYQRHDIPESIGLGALGKQVVIT